MGILNVTPDSFFDGGRYTNDSQLLTQAEKLLKEGAAIVDIGGMSSRPGAQVIDIEEELKRVLPAIRAVLKHFPDVLISIDTVHSRVASEAIAAGAVMVNDISAGSIDADFLETVGELGVPYVLMHMQGKPETMQQQPIYSDVIQEVVDFFIAKMALLEKAGITDVILDVGFGFGKTVTQNYQLLQQLDTFKLFNCPILAGISRKSMIYKPLQTTPDKALNGTIAANTIALLNGAKLLRVHDVQAAVEAIEIVGCLRL